VRVCTLGDLLLDVIVRLEQPLAPGGDSPAETRVGAGGQAANVAAWVAALGAEARLVGKRGDDAAGALAADRLSTLGVEVVGPVEPGSTGVVVSLVDTRGERTMASDRGVAPELAPEELDAAWFADCDRLHVSGYSLLAEPIGATAVRAAEETHAAGGLVSVDLPPWSVIERSGAEPLRARLRAIAPEVVFATEREAELLADRAAGVRVLKLGDRGCAVEADGRRIELPAVRAEVVDTTGAGDALAAGFLLGGSVEEAAQRGLATAARAVAKLGAMP
jgi:sugar/nucleoside kinase (ribokinase family)